TSYRSYFIWLSKRACFRKWTLKSVGGAISGVRRVPARELPHGEIRGVRNGVVSGGELQGVRAGREAGGIEVEDVSARRSQRGVKAEIAAGIGASRRRHAARIAGRAGDLRGVQRDGSGRNIIAPGIAKVEFDGERRAAGNRPCRAVQRVDPVGDIFGQVSVAAEKPVVAAVRHGDRMPGNGKRRGCE